MRKLKIVHVITGLNVGGAEIMLHKLLSRMDSRCFQNVVVSLTDVGPMGGKIQDLSVPLYSLGVKSGSSIVRKLPALVSLLARERPAIVQTWMYHADLFGLLSGKISRVPRIVWNIRCSDYTLYDAPQSTIWTMKICAMLSGQPSVVISNSEVGRVFHSRAGYHPRRWETIPNGFDATQFMPDISARASIRAELGACNESILIGLIGRFDPMKDHKTFLRAAGLLADRHSNVHFLLVGRNVTADNAQLTKEIVRNGLREHCHLLGERADVSSIMASLDIATSSSAYGEGFPNVVGEAMACGVPCVVTDVGDSAAIVGETGIVVPPGDPQAIANAWERLIRVGVEGRRELGMTARQRIEQNYSLDLIVRRYEDLYLSLGRA